MDAYELELLRRLAQQGGEGVLKAADDSEGAGAAFTAAIDNLHERVEIAVHSTTRNSRVSLDRYYAAQCSLTQAGWRTLEEAS